MPSSSFRVRPRHKMNLLVLLPVKPLSLSKSRLAAVLNPTERAAFVQDSLRRTLQALARVDAVNEILVISADADIWHIAESYGAKTLREEDVPGLNPSLRRGLAYAKQTRADTLMILPVDLPQINADSLREAIRLLPPAPSALIAPDTRGDGSNLLLFSPPDLITPCYGPNSFNRYQKALREINIQPVILRADALARDIDTPEDFAAYWNERTSLE